MSGTAVGRAATVATLVLVVGCSHSHSTTSTNLTRDGWARSASVSGMQLLTKTNHNKTICYQLVPAAVVNDVGAHGSYSCAGPEAFVIQPQLARVGTRLLVYGPATERVRAVEVQTAAGAEHVTTQADGFVAALNTSEPTLVRRVLALDGSGSVIASVTDIAPPP